MRLPLKNGCETSRCLVGDRWSNDGSDSVIVLIVVIIPLVIDDPPFLLSWMKTLCVCVKRVEMSWYESDLISNHGKYL
jgi:hypothetical protein